MSPYYFPFVMQTPGDSTQGHLTGYFDYRPKDTEEQVVVANSTNGGQSWNYVGTALAQNPKNYCPTGDTNDNGQGHSFVMTVGGNSYLYTVNRPAGDNLGVGLLVHSLNLTAANPVSALPAVESVGVDPDTFASAGSSVPTTGGSGATISVNSLNTRCRDGGSGPVRGPQRRLALGLGHHLHRGVGELVDRLHHRQCLRALGRLGRPAGPGAR